MYNNDIRVANTATPSYTQAPNVSQYGWTKAELGQYNQLIAYVDLVQKLYEDFLEKMGYVDEIIKKFVGLDEKVQYVTQKANEVAEDARQTRVNVAQATVLYNQVRLMKETLEPQFVDFSRKYLDFTTKYTDFAPKYTSIVSMHTEILQIAEELRNGQVYRGTWNPMKQTIGTWPDAEGKNSTWDVVLDEGTNEFNFGNFTWRSGDRLVYIQVSSTYDRVATGTGVFSVNNKSGVVVLNHQDVNAVGYYNISKNDDIDNIKQPGMYNVEGGNPNWAYGVDGGNMMVMWHGDEFVTQVAYSGATPRINTRSFTRGVWSRWVELYTEERRPLPSEIGAIDALNGVAAGTLALNAVSSKKVTFSDTAKYISVLNQELYLANKTAGGRVVLDSSLKPGVLSGGQVGEIYHTLNKPTPTDVGALATSEAETAGGLLMRVGGPRDQQIIEALAGSTGGAIMQEKPPLNPFPGARWFDTNEGRTYIWYEDADSGQWIEENPQSPDIIQTSPLLQTLANDERLETKVKMVGDFDIFHKGNKPTIADVDGLQEKLDNAGSGPILSAAWVQLRNSMWNGFVAADGQLLKRADYPDAWKAIEQGKVPVALETDWQRDPQYRGCFTIGDGSTTFRIPDYNGVSSGTLGAAFLRGDGFNAGEANGYIQGDAIRNITGNFGGGGTGNGNYFHNDSHVNAKGCFGSEVTSGQFRGTIETAAYSGMVKFDASKVVPTASDNHPVNVTGCWAIKLFGAVQNAGSIDAETLATQLAEAQSKLSALEAKTDKDYFFSQYFEPISIGTDSSVLPVFKDVQKVKGIVPHNNKDGVQVKKNGTYKITYGYTLEAQTNSQQTVLNLYLAGQSTGDAVAYLYVPRIDTGITVITMCTWSGVYDLRAGDDIWFRVATVNSTQARIFRTGYFQVEEL